ncbi:hypothetical protein ACO0LB_14240 [Undibacterium sp. SXout7W]|uniref:hypothetical protein n=1 Tax=Undibacterium sp. SXout7W TaxID=3413049 RepID=UPI003BF214F8
MVLLISRILLCILLSGSLPGNANTISSLDLSGYVDGTGAISVQEHGDTVDPYFVLQALLLAQDNQLNISAYAKNWVEWLITRQKPDGTFDRFCRNGPIWAPCKIADADDSQMALWLKLIESMPAELNANPRWRKSHAASTLKLEQLIDPQRGIYLVSPVYQLGLFMDNLEVLSYVPTSKNVTHLLLKKQLANNIRNVFWDKKDQRYLVSTQTEQKTAKRQFYPDDIAQIFPLFYRDAPLPTERHAYYRQWMTDHRRVWLLQSREDFAWGLIAITAHKEGDRVSAQCWLREAGQFRHTSHWIVTDEVVWQILIRDGLVPAGKGIACL